MSGNSRAYFQHDRWDVAQLLPTGYARVLEVGCADGGFRAYLSGEHEYWGIEPDRDAASIAERALDRVLVGTYDEVAGEIPDRYFDLVICNDVIEHMADHDVFLESIRGKMANGGALVASIPNVRCLRNLVDLVVRKDWHYIDRGILDRTHLRFFTERSLRRTLAAHGLEIEAWAGLYPVGKTMVRRILTGMLAMVLGGDIRFGQFGIRVRHREGS